MKSNRVGDAARSEAGRLRAENARLRAQLSDVLAAGNELARLNRELTTAWQTAKVTLTQPDGTKRTLSLAELAGSGPGIIRMNLDDTFTVFTDGSAEL